MAWPFGRKDRKEVEDDLTDERLRMMANVAIEQVPLPEEGIMTEEDAWTISPGPARVAMGGDSGPAAICGTSTISARCSEFGHISRSSD